MTHEIDLDSVASDIGPTTLADKTDLEIAILNIAHKRDSYNKFFRYYDGEQTIVYSASRLKKVFKEINARFIQNWMGVVIDSCLDRLELTGFSIPDNEILTDEINGLWQITQMNLDTHDAHLAALVTGEAFVIVGKDDSNRVEAYYNDPRFCHLEYNTQRPKLKRFGARMYHDSKFVWLTLYYDDRIIIYKAPLKNTSSLSDSIKNFVLEDEQTNPWGLMPIFHLRRELRKIKGELEQLIPLQDAVNKLFTDMMVSSEFDAFPQRWAISQTDVGDLKSSPDNLWGIPAGDGQGQQTSVGQFPASPLTNFLTGMSDLSASIAIISKTPDHFFNGQGGNISGEALIALEAPLNDKCKKYISRFQVVWAEIARFMLLVSDNQADNVIARFAEPATVQPFTESQIIKNEVDSGIPLVTVLREQAKWTQAQIEAMEADKVAEQEAEKQALATALLNASNQLQSGQQSNGLE